ncbi:hypothetical protein ACQY0O_004365 [Thecaphora frezii]
MSPLRRSARAGKQTDTTTTTATTTATIPSLASPQTSPSRPERKRKRSSLPESPADQAPSLSNGAISNQQGVTVDGVKSNAIKGPSQQEQANSSLEASSMSEPTAVAAETTTAAAPASASAPASGSEGESEMDDYKALLGIDALVSPQAVEASDTDADLQKFELTLLESDAAKLNAVLSSFAPETLDAQRPSKLQPSNGTKAQESGPKADLLPFATLREALVEGTRLRDIREHVLRLRSPLLQDPNLLQQIAFEPWTASAQSQKDGSVDQRSKLCLLTLVLSLVDQLARRYRQTERQGGPARGEVLASLVEKRAEALEKRNQSVKTEKDVDVRSKQLERDESLRGPAFVESGHASGKYALHMRLPRGDFYTKPVYLDSETLETLDAGQADLVAVAPEPKSTLQRRKHDHATTMPTLGERSGIPRAAKKAKTSSDRQQTEAGTLKPVAFLRYGNYASFAPSFDSAGATLSYTASARLWMARARARAAELSVWGPQPYQDELSVEDKVDDADTITTPPRMQGSAKAAQSSAEIDLAGLDESLDPDAIKSGLEQLEKEEKISAQLQHNLILLKKLQNFQWERLRRSYRPEPASKTSEDRTSTVKTAKGDVDDADEALQPSAEEQAVAEALLDSLASLIALQPHAANPVSDRVHSVVPERETIGKLYHTVGAIDPALSGEGSQPDYWGRLDEAASASNAKATRSRAGHYEAGHTNTAGALPQVIRSNSTVRLTEESESRAHGSGASPVYGRDKGRGMLERFASSRAYSKEDKHDIELPTVGTRSATRGQASPQKAPSGGGPPRPSSNAAMTASSPSTPHLRASPSSHPRSQSGGSLPPHHPHHPHHHPKSQAQPMPSTPSSAAAARYPAATRSSYPHGPNGVTRPPPQQQQQPGTPYHPPQHHPGQSTPGAAAALRGYGPPSAPSPNPGPHAGPTSGPNTGSISYAYAAPVRPYGYSNANPAPAAMAMHGMPSPAHPQYAAQLPYGAPPSPSKGYAYPSPGVAVPSPGGAGGYAADWSPQQHRTQNVPMAAPMYPGPPGGHGAMPPQLQHGLASQHPHMHPQSHQHPHPYAHPHPHQHPHPHPQGYTGPAGYQQYAMR